MLNFDSSHNSINGSLSNNKNKIKVKKIVLGTLMIGSVFLFGGCAKNIDCDIEGMHAHKYVSEVKFDKYLVSEKENMGKWTRTNDYIQINKDGKKLLDFINDKGLYEIDNNREKIDKIVNTKEDYVEYRYSYFYMMPIPHYTKIGKTSTVTYTYVPMNLYSWTDDAGHSRLTGQQRVVHHVYQGYKVIKDEKGKYKIKASEFVENIDDLPEEYKYIKSDFVKKVYSDNRKKEVDYEDGPEEEKNKDVEKKDSKSKSR